MPLWWDAGTLADLTARLERRRQEGAKRDDPFVCLPQNATLVEPHNRHVLRRRFHTAYTALGAQCLYGFTIHHRRHAFISHALASGRTLAEVRDAAGHSNVSITSAYLHVAVDEGGALGNLFEFD